jgi:hypothetical protein
VIWQREDQAWPSTNDLFDPFLTTPTAPHSKKQQNHTNIECSVYLMFNTFENSSNNDIFSFVAMSADSVPSSKTNIFQSKLYTLIYCHHFRTYSWCAMFDWSDTVFRRRNQLKMEGSFDIPCVGGSLYHWKGTQCIIGRGFNIPWVWDSI